MNKKIFLFPLFLVLMSCFVFAQAMPHPVYGKITDNGDPVYNIQLKVSNLHSGKAKVVSTNTAGFYQADLANFDIYYRDGDDLQVCLVYCDDQDNCCKNTEVSGGGNEVTFDLTDELLPSDLPDEAIIIRYVCYDGSVLSTNTCPVAPVVDPVVEIQCLDGSIVADASDCPESEDDYLWWILGAGLLTICGVTGAGIASYQKGQTRGLDGYNKCGYWRFGGGKVDHYHKGIRSYHDPNTKHKVAKYSHARYKDSAKKCVQEIKNLEANGDVAISKPPVVK